MTLLKLGPNGPMDSELAFVQVMHIPSDKPLFEPMPTHFADPYKHY